MAVDNFWKLFWLGTGAVLLVGFVMSISLFFMYTGRSGLLAGVGAFSFDANADPFQRLIHGTFGASTSTITSGVIYQDALPLRFQSWAWHAQANWRSTQQVSEGPRAMKAVFEENGGTAGMSGVPIDTSAFHSLSIAVRPQSALKDVYIELYDSNGISLGIQSLAWYAPEAHLTPEVWQTIEIPLQNLLGAYTSNIITGFSVSSHQAGAVFVDEVVLGKTSFEHPVWVAPVDTPVVPYDPFATSTPISLPYTLGLTAKSLSSWHTYFGNFVLENGAVEVGSKQNASSTGSLSTLPGGKNWGDYRVDAEVEWGQMSVFAILVRMTSDGDFASCSFSQNGEVAQIYLVSEGTSTLVKSEIVKPYRIFPIGDIEARKKVKLRAEILSNRLTCVVNGLDLVSAHLKLPTAGSVGIETWDAKQEASPNKLQSLTISPVRI